jgi:hypothetical protein
MTPVVVELVSANVLMATELKDFLRWWLLE